MADEPQRVRVSTDLSLEAFVLGAALVLASSCVGSTIQSGASDIAKAIKEQPECQSISSAPAAKERP